MYTTPQLIIDLCCDEFGIQRKTLFGKRRFRNIVMARQMACKLIKDELDYPLVAIGELMGGRDHSTVINSIRVINNLLVTNDNRTVTAYNNIKTNLFQKPSTRLVVRYPEEFPIHDVLRTLIKHKELEFEFV